MTIIFLHFDNYLQAQPMSQQVQKVDDTCLLSQLYKARSGSPCINYQQNEIDQELQSPQLPSNNSSQEFQEQSGLPSKQLLIVKAECIDGQQPKKVSQNVPKVNTQLQENEHIQNYQQQKKQKIVQNVNGYNIQQNGIDYKKQDNKKDQTDEQPRIKSKIQPEKSGRQTYIGQLTKSTICDIAKQKCLKSENQLNPFQIFVQHYENILQLKNLNQSIKMYFLTLIQHQEDDAFFQHFIEQNILETILEVLRKEKYSSELIKAVFQSLELLLRGLHKQEQCIYFTLTIAKSGLLEEKFQFVQEQDAAYYANFLKILARKINEDEKYLSVFINAKDPDFPLMKNLLRFYNTSDIILHTSSKLAIMELCNNQHSLVKKYISNFPFVIFYPCYVEPIAKYLEDLIKNEDELQKQNLEQNLKNSIKFMEDFSSNKPRQFIDMYVNSFFYLVGKNYYKAFENKANQVKLLKILYNLILPQITVLKIKIGFQQMFKSKISKQMLNYLKGKTEHLNNNYWLLDQSKNQIKKHCEQVIFKDDDFKQLSRGSWIGTMYSYIPKTNSNWFYHELRKLSDIIGVNIELNKKINHDFHNFNSYLSVIQSEEIKSVDNLLFQNLIHKQQNQQVLYWFLKVSTELNFINEENLFSILHEVSRCTSLSVVRQFYEAIIKKNLAFNETESLSHHYSEITQKLIYFVLTEGWKSFKNRAKIPPVKEYSQDIFRDIDCDIVYFVALRHILGTPNNSCSDFNDALIQQLDNQYKQIKVKCQLTNSQGPRIFLILDGQYIKLQSQQEQLLTKEALLLRDFAFYQQELTFQVVDKHHQGTKQNFRIYFPEEPIRQFIGRQIKWRKQSSMNIELELKTLKFLTL